MHRIISIVILLATTLRAQPYDLLLKNGHVIDPANQIDGIRDIGITGNQIARVATAIPAREGRKTIDVSGLYVTPGLIDIHAHAFGNAGALFPDDTALTTGTTTIVDAEGSGWRTFEEHKKKIIDTAKTRILVFINIVGAGKGCG